jgi:Ca2+-binding RTX toxin-like protein
MVQLFRTDLQFVLDQILLAESGGLPPTAFHPWGLRTVNGTFNHIIPGQETWGSADQLFPRLLTPVWRDATAVTMPGLPGQPLGSLTSYTQTSGFVFDLSIRLISNLIVDQTANNPAAIEAAFGLAGLSGAANIPALQLALSQAQASAAAEAEDIAPLAAALTAANALAASAASAAVTAQAQATADSNAAAAAQSTAVNADASAASALATLNALLNADVTPEAIAAAQAAYDAATASANAADAAAAAAATTAAAAQSAALSAASAAASAASAAADAQAAHDAAIANAAAAQLDATAAAAALSAAQADQTVADAAASAANANLATAQSALTDAQNAQAAADAAALSAAADASAAASAAADADVAEAAAQTALNDAQAALDALIASGASQAEIDAATALRDQRQGELASATSASNAADAAAASAAQISSDAAAAASAAAAAVASAQSAVDSAQASAVSAAAAAAAAAQAVTDANDALTLAQTALDAANANLSLAQAALTDAQNAQVSADAAALAAAADAATAASAAADADAAEAAAQTALNDAQAALDTLVANGAPQVEIDAATALRDQRQGELTSATSASNAADVTAANAAQAASDAAAAASAAASAVAAAQSDVDSAQAAAVAAAAAAAAAAQAVTDANAALALAQTALNDANANLTAAQSALTDAQNAQVSADAAALAAAADAALAATAAADADAAEATAQAALGDAQTALNALIASGASQAEIDAATALRDQRQGELATATSASNVADAAAASAAQTSSDAAAAASAAAASVAAAQSDADSAQAAAISAAAAAAAAAQAVSDANDALAIAQAALDAANALVGSTLSDLEAASLANTAAQTALSDANAQAAATAAAAADAQSQADAANAAEQVALDALTALQNADVPQATIDAAQDAYNAAAAAAAAAHAQADALLTLAFASAAIAATATTDATTAAANAAAARTAYNAAVQESIQANAALQAAQTALDAAMAGSPIVVSPGLDGLFGTGDDRDVFFIPNTAPDEGLSAPFNSWFTLFGQFFDHGLDLVNKGGSGTVIMPLLPDDPLYDFGADGIVSSDDGFGADGAPNTADDRPNFMALTRATNQPGPDGILGTADDVREHNNQTTPFIDQNQTYTSHPAHQVFLREYRLNENGDAVSTGRFLDGAHGGLATWADIKNQARDLLGVLFSDHDVHNIPLVLTDAYGRFIPGANGYAQIGVRVANGADGLANTADDTIVFVEGVAGGLDINSPAAIAAALAAAGSAFATGTVVRINHAFLDDIAHGAAPGTFNHDGNSATPPINQTGDADDLVGNNDGLPGTFDDELLDAHFITGDGRGNENIGLTAVHTIFHAEHNRLVGAIHDEVRAILATDGISDFVRGWVTRQAGETDAQFDARILDGISEEEFNGERVFQAARVFTEMQYQHLVFEEFARKIHPGIDIFINVDMTLNPAIFAEFAHVVYRFGHSMLTETVDRFDADFSLVNSDDPLQDDASQIGLIAAFLNPLEFVASGADAADASASIIRGMTRQSGNAIDEFITEALRNNLVGLPLDLASLNIARGRDAGIPGLNEARRQFFAMTQDSALTPYTSWIDFAHHVKHPASVINFIAAYGTHALITAETTMEGRRAAAMAIVSGQSQTLADGRVIATPGDALAFLNATGAYAGGSLGGLENVDFWIGGLAEQAPAFGSMLGTTFAFVFETQLEMLQNGDRFYYLARFSGLNFLAELEGNSFASMIMRNTDLRHLPGDVFATPDWTLEVDQTTQFTGLGPNNNADPTWADEGEPNNIFLPLVSRDNPATAGSDTNYLRYNGGGHVVLGGTDNADILIGGIGDDTAWGDGGHDRIEGGAGADILNGGDGNDIITDMQGDDNIKGGDGDDVIHSGDGIDLVIAGRGNDFVNLGSGEGDEVFGGLGNDFLTGDGTLTGLVGGFGDDWVESAFGIGGLTGDNADVDGAALNFAGEDVNGGHDVLIGGGAPNDFDSFGGDDIMVSGTGTDRLEGFIGFDWVSYQNNTNFGAVADMEIRVFGQPPLPGDPGATLDRFDMVEGLSGSQLDDVLRGDDRVADALTEPELTLTGHELNAEGIARIEGLGVLLGVLAAGANGVVGDADDMFTGGNIILGGGGSDLMEGRGGNDVLDGDAYLSVAIGVDRNNDGDFNDANERATSMRDIQAEMLAGTLTAAQLGIVREILVAPTQDIDTAVFTGNRADYFVEGQDSFEGISDQDGDGFIQVVNLARDGQGIVIPGAVGIDGFDYLRNIERLQFNDTIVQIGDVANQGPDGVPIISDTTPTEGQTITVNVAGVTDPDNTATAGIITGLTSITWQQDNGDGIWVDIMVTASGTNGNEGPVPATGPSLTLTQLQAGAAVRVRFNYIDQNGVLETVFSAPTTEVTPINDAPVGALVISDIAPTEGDILSATVAFIDPDGTDGAVFTFQWQQQLANGTWQDIAGQTLQQFIPTAAQIGRPVRATVTYTDDFGTVETVTSAATDPVGDFITGTNAANTITATAFSDRVQGLNGADTLNGAGGSDVLEGGAGGDTLNGGAGADFLFGEGGADTMNGDGGNDTLNGGAGADQANGGAGNDTIQYVIGDGADVVDGGADTDTYAISGTTGDDVLDIRFNGTRLITVEGGAVSNVEIVNANLQGGSDTLNYATTAAAIAVAVNLSTGVASGFTTITSIENVTGGLGGDNIVGSGGTNILTGFGGADVVNGAGGDDVIVATAGDGNDTYIGGLGVDFYNLANTTANATVNLTTGVSTSAQTGTDTLSEIEGVIGSFGIDNITGNANANIIDGGDAGDTINGGAGNDTLSGGLGNGDIVNGGAGDDVIIYNFGDGADASYDGGADNDTLRVVGSGGSDTLTVVWNGSRLTSSNGTTLLNIEAVTADLGDGNDRLDYTGTGGANGVTVHLGTNSATGFSQIAGIENVTGGAGGDTITGGNGVNNIDGAGGADTIDGGAGNDVLAGGGGNDIMIGGLGNDTMNGNGGNDRFVFSGAFGNDVINGFDSNPTGGQDTLDVRDLGVTAANFASLVTIAQQGANVLVTINGQTITLAGETAANVTISDFLVGP